MNCDRYRTSTSADADTAHSAAARAHLAGCEACRTWTDALDAIRHAAAELGGEPPADLSQRLVAATAAAPTLLLEPTGRTTAAVPGLDAAPSGATRALSPVRRLRPGLGAVASLAAAAVAIATIAIAMSGDVAPGRGEPVHVLAAAADAVSAGGTGFRFTLVGSLQTEVDLPALPEPPDLPQLPPLPELPEIGDLPALPSLPTLPSMPVPRSPGVAIDLERFCVGLPEVAVQACLDATAGIDVDVAPGDRAEVQRAIEEAFAEAHQRMQDTVDAAREELQEAMAQARTQLTAARDELVRVTGKELGSVERAGDLRITFIGDGESNGDGDLAVTIDFAFDSPVESMGGLEVRTVDDVSYVRHDRTIGWISMAAPYAGFVIGELSAPRDLDTLLEDLRRPGARIEELGDETRAGVAVRGLRFEGAGGADVTAWVGVDDGLPREVSWVREHGHDADPVQMRAETTLHLTDLGAEVEIVAPSDATPISALPPSQHPPFAPTLGIELRFDARLEAGAER